MFKFACPIYRLQIMSLKLFMIFGLPGPFSFDCCLLSLCIFPLSAYTTKTIEHFTKSAWSQSLELYLTELALYVGQVSHFSIQKNPQVLLIQETWPTYDATN